MDAKTPKGCENCGAPNIFDANWCTACGSAFVDPVKEYPTAVHDMRKETRGQGSFLQWGGSGPEHEQNSSPKRHWEGSKYYMWRKPCSYVKPTDKSVVEHMLNSTVQSKVRWFYGSYHVINSVAFFWQVERQPRIDFSILNCPIEVLILIFSFLSQCDLLHCMRVCRTFHDIANFKIFCKCLIMTHTLGRNG